MIWTPQQDRGKWKSLGLAAAVHLALVVALFVGVQWKSRPPSSVEVELWDSTPSRPLPAQTTPPEAKPQPKPEPKIEPKPEPKPDPKPDIAIKDPKKKEEPKKPEPKPEPKVDPFKDQLDREQKMLDQQKRMQQQTSRAAAEERALQEAQNEQRAAASRRGLADYASKIRGKIRGNIVLPQSIQGNPEAVFEVTQLPTGEVMSVRMKKSSGNANLDSAIERAILKSSPLPKPDQPELFRRELEIKYRPFED